jgi:hypothetical protein
MEDTQRLLLNLMTTPPTVYRPETRYPRSRKQRSANLVTAASAVTGYLQHNEITSHVAPCKREFQTAAAPSGKGQKGREICES